MKERPLIETNPYLSDPETYREQLIDNVMSSTAIEIGEISEDLKNALRNYELKKNSKTNLDISAE